MLFDKKKYYKYSQDLKFEIGFIISISTILLTILTPIIYGILNNFIQENITFMLEIILITIVITVIHLHVKKLEIKLQEMYFIIDIYEKIQKKEG